MMNKKFLKKSGLALFGLIVVVTFGCSARSAVGVANTALGIGSKGSSSGVEQLALHPPDETWTPTATVITVNTTTVADLMKVYGNPRSDLVVKYEDGTVGTTWVYSEGSSDTLSSIPFINMTRGKRESRMFILTVANKEKGPITWFDFKVYHQEGEGVTFTRNVEAKASAGEKPEVIWEAESKAREKGHGFIYRLLDKNEKVFE